MYNYKTKQKQRMERKIGERFEYQKVILEVKEGDCLGDCCDKCFFGYIDDLEFVCLGCFATDVPLGQCNGNYRTDGKDIFFEKVGEVNNEE